MKDQLGGKLMSEFVALRLKTCSYLTDDTNKNKKSQRRHKKVCRKTKI